MKIINNYMKLSRDGLQRLLQENAVELMFIRRHEKVGWPIGRRMLCTLDKNLLLSLPGRMSLKFRPAVHPPPYPAKAYGLLVVWDVFWQDYRAIPVDSVSVVSVIPTHTKKAQDEWWAYFSEFLGRLTPQQKEQFMARA